VTAPERLTLTLEEARVLLSKNGKCLRFMVETVTHRSVRRLISSDWAEAVTAALDLPEPVVARDEAAELRAENERLRADLFEYVLDGFVQGAHRQEDGGYHTGGISTYRDLGNWLVEHAHWTRRPGGRGRNQVYDPPKADAASEGQP